jgi:hypothetical protein
MRPGAFARSKIEMEVISLIDAIGMLRSTVQSFASSVIKHPAFGVEACLHLVTTSDLPYC